MKCRKNKDHQFKIVVISSPDPSIGSGHSVECSCGWSYVQHIMDIEYQDGKWAVWSQYKNGSPHLRELCEKNMLTKFQKHHLNNLK